MRVSELYPSDLCAVSNNGCTLFMLAAMNNQELLLRDLIEKGLGTGGQGHGKTQFCPLDFRQMKVCGDDAIDLSCDSSCDFFLVM